MNLDSIHLYHIIFRKGCIIKICTIKIHSGNLCCTMSKKLMDKMVVTVAYWLTIQIHLENCVEKTSLFYYLWSLQGRFGDVLKTSDPTESNMSWGVALLKRLEPFEHQFIDTNCSWFIANLFEHLHHYLSQT